MERFNKKYFILVNICLIVINFIHFSCSIFEKEMKNKYLNTKEEVQKLLSSSSGTYSVAFKDLQNGEVILINEQIYFHAASTMKTPVMIEVFKQAQFGKFNLSDSVEVKNDFKSIVDGSSFSIDKNDDSEKDLYNLIGRKTTIYDLITRMITISSNLATNILIEIVGPDNVTESMRQLGANMIKVLRGVEDSKAYNKGLNNITTAFDLMIIYDKIAKGEILSEESHKKIIDILLNQKFNDIIPAKLPKDIKVAHKTGSITNVEHDSGIVFLPDGRKYVLVLLSKDLPNNNYGKEVLSKVSNIIYENLYKN